MDSIKEHNYDVDFKAGLIFLAVAVSLPFIVSCVFSYLR